MAERYKCTTLSHGDFDLYLPTPADFYFNPNSTAGQFSFTDGADLLSKYPKLDLNTTVFVANATAKTVVEGLGFVNVVDCHAWAGEHLIFPNGNYLSITSPYATQGRVDPVLSNGTVLYTNQIQPAWVGNNRQATFFSYFSNIAYDSVIDSILGVNTYNVVYLNISYSDTYSRYNEFSCDYVSGVGQIMPDCNILPVSGQWDIRQFWNGIDPPPVHSDPYADAGDSTTGGGDGTFDGSSDTVPVPSLPSIGATDTGFISLFVPSASQIRQVASYLWSNFFDLATFKKLFEDPMDCILGLSVVPVSVPTSGSAQITVGNVELSGISLPLASQQYVEIDCGTVDFTRRYFGSYLDFEPYTKMSLFVPYSGVHAICADDVIGKVVGLKYHIDILTGSLVAFLTCGDSVLYEFNGACASNIPVNSMNYASTIENAIRIAVNIGTTVATAGAAAPLTGENAAARTAAKEFGTKVSIAGSTAEGALSLKPSIDRAGSLGGTTGLMGNQIPYFIITRPRMCKPKNQDVFQGYPSFIQTTIGDMEGTGFTAFENVILAGSYLTDTEKSELESILSAGVYL